MNCSHKSSEYAFTGKKCFFLKYNASKTSGVHLVRSPCSEIQYFGFILCTRELNLMEIPCHLSYRANQVLFLGL